ncbi:Serine/threonine protein kinase [Phytophthora cinnamomi]|uniref:Serine/threonine protein kinase n=1 Tax=Phytophthora cinnamomi TaxID=4785 RepID=UPI00355A8CEE|nr:Serine/threonine protein kinase [Phytophthora cinnamomi]
MASEEHQVDDKKDEQQPLLTSVKVVCREAPALMEEQQVVRRIEVFLDYSPQYWLHKASRDLPLRLVKRVFACKIWDRDDVNYSIGQAASAGKLDVIQWLCSKAEEALNVQTSELLKEYNTLAAAAYNGHLDVMKWFVENGAQVNQGDGEGSQALVFAAGNGHFTAVQWLVEHGATLGEAEGGDDTALHGAAACGALDIVKYLVEKGARVDEKSYDGKSVLHYAAGASKESVELVQFLLDCGLLLSDVDELGRTALYYASVSQNFEVVDLLLKAAIKDNRLPEADLSRCFLEVAKGGRQSLIQQLIEYGVDLQYANFQGKNALHEAVGAGSVNVVEFLLDRGVNLHRSDKFGATPVLEAARHGHLEALRRLLEVGGNISDVNIAGQTALHLSAQGGYKEVCGFLFGYGADGNCCDQRGWTPLHSAAAAGHVDVVESLIANGAKLDAVTLSGQTALALAQEGGHHETAQYLSEQGETQDSVTPNGAKPDPFAEYNEHLLHSAEVHFNSITTTVQHCSDGLWLDSPIQVKLKKQKWNSKGFLETLKQWSRLNHPHIVKLYGFSHSDNASKEPYFVCEATTQLDTGADRGDLWDILYQASLGLRYLHDRNIVHGTLYLDSIVMTSSGVAKIGVFDGCFDTYLPWCTAPEIIVGLPASFESDVYVFGLVIVDVISGRGMWKFDENSATQDAILSDELLSKPDNMTPYQWNLVERMCRYNPTDRLSMADVVRELEALTKNHTIDQDSSSESETVSTDEHDSLSEDHVSNLGLGHVRIGASTIARILTEIDTTCRGSMTIDSMNRDVYDRLIDIFNQLQEQSSAPTSEIIQRYSNIVRYFHMRLQTTSSVGSSQAARFAASRQAADDTFSVHGDIDGFMAIAALSQSAPIHQWRDQWELRRRQQQREMLQKLENLPALLEDVDDEMERDEALTYLRFELSKYPTSYATSKTGEFTQVKSTITALSTVKNPNWFIPAHEVQFDKFDEFSRGGFGKVYHGKWKRSEVVVKKVKLKTDEDKAAFLNESECADSIRANAWGLVLSSTH